MKTAAGRRLFTFLRGRNAERIALVFLMAKGYRPLARRFSAAGGEVDLIVRRGGAIAFVEVKVRAQMEAALVSIDPAKGRRIGRAARVWVARNPWALALTLRGDAVFLAPGIWPRHLPDAFRIEA